MLSPLNVCFGYFLNLIYVEIKRKKFKLISKEYFLFLNFINLLGMAFCVMIYWKNDFGGNLELALDIMFYSVIVFNIFEKSMIIYLMQSKDLGKI